MLIDDSYDMQDFPKWFMKYRPEVIISSHECAYDWLLKLKVDVPGEVGFVHLDLDPQLMKYSGIDQRSELIGTAAADMLINQLNCNERGVPLDPKLLLIEPVWIEGTSTRKTSAERDESSQAKPRKTKSPTPKEAQVQ